MFQIGDYIVYGNSGVCKVEAVGTMEPTSTIVPSGTMVPGEIYDAKLYYTLIPVYGGRQKIYTPVDNEKVVMRPVLTKKEAVELIHKIPNIELLYVPDEKGREQVYKSVIKTCDCKELIKIIKTLYVRKKSRLAEGKKVTAVDEKYLRTAETYLYGELSIPLEMEKNQVEDYIINSVQGLTAKV